MKLSWSEWLSVISISIALLSLLMNFSKLFIDLIDRHQKLKKEKIDSMKAKLTVTTLENETIIFENKGSSDAYIKNILIDNKHWDEVFIQKMPTLISSEQTKLFSISHVSHQLMEIEYADDYSNKYLNSTVKKAFEL
jgi:hypothetical protein